MPLKYELNKTILILRFGVQGNPSVKCVVCGSNIAFERTNQPFVKTIYLTYEFKTNKLVNKQ